ncbi:hypothetical protein CC2G_003934 [Coprinopsis cinerea AmutBmut pab1-1]|nr:hypothetical protein CC2G_003934 [Coprinopsis cinerea AmutBmut pab1-1]
MVCGATKNNKSFLAQLVERVTSNDEFVIAKRIQPEQFLTCFHCHWASFVFTEQPAKLLGFPHHWSRTPLGDGRSL